MIVLHATLPVDPDRREDALEIAETLVEQSNEESGVVDYRAATDVQDPNTIRFTERYEDDDAVEAHLESDHYQAFAEQLPGLLAGQPEVIRFEVESAEKLDL